MAQTTLEQDYIPQLPPLLTPEQTEQWQQWIGEAQHIVICTHKSPDGDALCSSLALANFLQTEGKMATIVIPDAFPDFLQWLPGANAMVRHDKRPAEAERRVSEADLIFCLDFNAISRVAKLQTVLEETPARKILIDHHLNPDIDASLIVSKPKMSSTTELIFRLVTQLNGLGRVGMQFFTCCYCGMMTDTGNFSFNCSAPDFFHIIAYLVSKGVDKEKINQRVYNSFSSDCLRFRAYVISEKMRVIEKHHAAYFAISHEDQQRFHFVKGDAEGLVNEPLRIKDIYLSISLRCDSVQPDLVWVSLRSVGNYHCNRLAEKFFNGGGHANAAGGRLYCSLQEAETIVQQAIEVWLTMQ